MQVANPNCYIHIQLKNEHVIKNKEIGYKTCNDGNDYDSSYDKYHGSYRGHGHSRNAKSS